MGSLCGAADRAGRLWNWCPPGIDHVLDDTPNHGTNDDSDGFHHGPIHVGDSIESLASPTERSIVMNDDPVTQEYEAKPQTAP